MDSKAVDIKADRVRIKIENYGSAVTLAVFDTSALQGGSTSDDNAGFSLCVTSPFDSSLPITFKVLGSHEANSSSDQITSMKNQIRVLEDKVQDYDRAIILMNLDETEEVGGVQMSGYLDQKIEKHTRQGTNMRSFLLKAFSSKNKQIMELKDEIRVCNRICSLTQTELVKRVKSEGKAQVKIESLTEICQNLESGLRGKDRRLVEMKKDLEEDQKNLDEALDSDLAIKTLVTKLGLVRSKERQLNELCGDLDNFLSLERDGSRMEIELLEKENAYLKRQSRVKQRTANFYKLVENERVTQLQQKVRALEDEVMTANTNRFLQARDDAETIHDLKERNKIQGRFSTAHQHMDEDIRKLEIRLERERLTSQGLKNELQRVKDELKEKHRKMTEKEAGWNNYLADFQDARGVIEKALEIGEDALRLLV